MATKPSDDPKSLASEKKSKKAGVPKPLYIGLSFKNTDGTPLHIDRKQIKVDFATRNSASVIEKMSDNADLVYVKTAVE